MNETVAAPPKSFKVAVRTASCGPTDWSYNAMRYATEQAAKDAGASLYRRWTAVTHYEVHPSDDEPNA
jgi:hypothetical protein